MSTRRILNTLTAALANSAPAPTVSQSPSSSLTDDDGPSMFPDSSIPYFMTLHALLPDLLLPALDLLDRGLVERICRDQSSDEGSGEAELVFYAVYADEDDDDKGEQSEAGKMREDDEFDIVRLTAWNCTCAEFAMDAFGDDSMGLKAQMSGMEDMAGLGDLTGIEAFLEGLDVEVEEYDEDEGYVDEKELEVGAEDEEGVVEDILQTLVDTVVSESGEHEGSDLDRKSTSASTSPSPSTLRLRQGTAPLSEQASLAKHALHESTVKDIVNDLIDSVVMQLDMERLGCTMAEAFIQELADVTSDDTDEKAGSEGQTHKDDEDEEWTDEEADEEEEGEEEVVYKSIESEAEDEWEDEEEDDWREDSSDGTPGLSLGDEEERGEYESSRSKGGSDDAQNHTADTEPDHWQAAGHGFGGISKDGLLKDDHLVPCCKHLLACFLVEKCGSLLRPYIEERSVDIHELAGMAAI